MTTDAALPARIGPYRIVSLLGEGGMGRVYLAREEQPAREVALKVLRAAAGAAFQQRFQREIELMAALEHPGIARLYAAGTAQTDSGPLPYLAMEYVRGRDLLAHAQQEALSLEARLALLAQVCRAVHHAHSRGVIHRDLKPGNVLVDEHGTPKVLDFGVAHVAADDATQMTVAGQVLGTIPYMSDEQLAGGARGADPRADVYSLGVIAFQLVSGQLPWDGGPQTSVIAALEQRRTSAPRRLSALAREARGDVDTLVHKAMAAEPAARYGSAAELAADLERYLARRPIEARPPTVGYTLSLFVRRHRAVAAAAGAAALALVAGAVISLYFAVSASRRAAEREAVSHFLVQMLTSADPEQALGERLTVRDVLDVARSELDAGSAMPSGAVAQLRRAIGNTYVSLGRADEGLRQLEQAAAEMGGAAALDFQQLRWEQAMALQARGADADAEARLRELLAEIESEADAAALRVLTRTELGAIIDARGDLPAAEAMLREALVDAERVFGPDDPATLDVAHRLALSLNRQGRYADSQVLALRAADGLALRRGPDHLQTLRALTTVAQNHRDLGEPPRAVEVYQRIVAGRERALGSEHTLTQSARSGLASALAAAGRAKEGAPLSKQAWEGTLARLGADSNVTRVAAVLHAYVVSEAGDYESAVAVLRNLIRQAEARPDGPSASDLAYYNNLSFNLIKLGRLAEARDLLRTLLANAERLLGREHTHYGLFEDNYGECLRQLGDRAGARAAFSHSHAVLLKQLGPDHPRTKRVADRLKQVGGA